MNKRDLVFITTIMVFSITLFLLFRVDNKAGKKALVYHDSELVLTISLEQDNVYEVMGDNGIVKIEVNNNQIRVIAEDSPLHICSKQGYIDKSYESIVCLPNHIVINISDNDLDGVVK